jgi:hypothetical protein
VSEFRWAPTSPAGYDCCVGVGDMGAGGGARIPAHRGDAVAALRRGARRVGLLAPGRPRASTPFDGTEREPDSSCGAGMFALALRSLEEPRPGVDLSADPVVPGGLRLAPPVTHRRTLLLIAQARSVGEVVSAKPDRAEKTAGPSSTRQANVLVGRGGLS